MSLFYFPYLPPPIHTIWTIQLPLWWPHTSFTSLISTLYFFLSSITISFYALYIVDHMYTHIIIYLVFKVTKTTKELIWVLLFIPLRRSDKQDRMNHSFSSTSSPCQQLGIQHGGLHPSCCLLGYYRSWLGIFCSHIHYELKPLYPWSRFQDIPLWNLFTSLC